MTRSHDRSGHYCNDFIAAFARVLPKPTTPFLDCDTTPALTSRYAKRKTKDAFVREALAMLDHVKEGQIGIYASRFGGTFYGYAIKYPGETPYFEEAQPEAEIAP